MKKLFFFTILLIFFWAPFVAVAADVPETGAPPVQDDEFFRAKVVKILQENETQEFGQSVISQNVKVEILQGPDKGTQVEFIHEVSTQKQDQKLNEGEKIIVGKNIENHDQSYYFSDKYRLNALWSIFGFFFVLTLVLAGRQGLRAFIGLVLSFGIIGFAMIPLILKGWSPLPICFIGAIAIAGTTLYVAHGFKMRTTVALMSILVTLGLAAILSFVFVVGAKLFGLGSEEAFLLQLADDTILINMRGLLLGGILIGTLGVLDDVTTAQAATVEEIHKANRSLGFSELYARGISVGKEHIVSLVNTLVLAYTGASFPLLLLFSFYQKPVWTTLNSEIMAEEIVRMLVGSVALMCAVPIVTALAAAIFSHDKEVKHA